MMLYGYLADVVVALHVAYVLAVVVGLVLILVGGARGWDWVSNRWFRLLHLGMIVGVIIRAMIWNECPLTWWERGLRIAAGQVDAEGYVNFAGAPVGKFLHDLIHPSLPIEVFPIIYVLFGALVIASLWMVPVRWRGTTPEPEPAT